MANSRNSKSPDPLGDALAACLRRHLTPGQSLVAGFSGGRDSTALLHALHRLQPDFGFQLSACHVNHGLSPHAEEWQTFCGDFCDALEIKLQVVRVKVPHGTPQGLEAAARAERYAAFGELDGDWLVLAQHRGDQAETLLFNLLRGTGLSGAAAMQETREVRRGMRLMRPLLDVARKDIESYLQKHALSWVEDGSNADTGFSRNYLRHQVLPVLQSRFPAAEENLAAATRRFAEVLALLDDLAILDLGGAPPQFPIAIASLESMTETRGRNLLRFLLARHGARIPSEARLIEALRQLLEAGPDRHPVIVFGDWQLCRRRGEVHLEPV
ncbi:MAG: tRNA lysidine(34) synthetase TilS [Betaproteobacteria bacterium]|nr:tRNA lysidine(34) synthetase TilS [Betaproteobacteria bacterium]